MILDVYLEFIKKSFQQRYTYRANSYIQIFGTLLTLFITMSAWTALYSGAVEVKGVSLKDMVTFVTINIIVGSLISSHIAETIAIRVNDGTIASDFIKPVDFKLFIFSNQLGENLFSAVFTALPACICAAIFWGLKLPGNISAAIIFLIALVNGIILIYHINYVLGLLSFWFKTAFYVRFFLRAFFGLFAGTFVPLWFYPDFLYKISLFLPFRFVSFEPIAIYLGKISFDESIKVILFQFMWIIILSILERYTWKKAQNKLTVHGG